MKVQNVEKHVENSFNVIISQVEPKVRLLSAVGIGHVIFFLEFHWIALNCLDKECLFCVCHSAFRIAATHTKNSCYKLNNRELKQY